MSHRPHTLTSSLGLLLLRLGFGALMAAHGQPKLQKILDGELADFGDPIGLGPAASLILVTIAELGCAILVALGVVTRVAALPVVFAMGVAAFVVHADDPWMGASPSKEPALLFLTAFLTLVFTGPGRFSVDALIWRKRGDNSGKKSG